MRSTAAEAREAGGSQSDAFNGKIVRDTVSATCRPDAPGFANAADEAISGLRELKPRSAREAMLAAQLLASDAAAMESYRRARASSGALRDLHTVHAAKFSKAHAALSEALDRLRGGGAKGSSFNL